jgi:hypothetical protein
MAPITVSTGQLAGLAGLIRGVVRFVRRLALVAAGSVAVLALLLRRDGFTAAEAGLTVLLLAPAAILLFFAQGVRELLSLPERLRRMPGEGQERLAELARLGAQARTTRARALPLLLWRLRGALGSLRDVAGLAVPLRVLTPGFVALAALSALLCVLIPGAALVALLVVAVA